MRWKTNGIFGESSGEINWQTPEWTVTTTTTERPLESIKFSVSETGLLVELEQGLRFNLHNTTSVDWFIAQLQKYRPLLEQVTAKEGE